MWSDAHTHLKQYLPYAEYLKETGIRAIVNSQSKTEWEWNQHYLTQAPKVTISYGVHPWNSAGGLADADWNCLAQAEVVGEIGIDQEWTTLPLEVQFPVFEQQLQLASTSGKPIVLHTKAAERAVLQTLRKYPGRYLIHWYDCPDYITDFIKLGCWFSIGPDVAHAPAVQQLAQCVPADKLLLETDGLDAVAWALNESREAWLPPERWEIALERSAEIVAGLRHTTPEVILRQAEKNFIAFLHKS